MFNDAIPVPKLHADATVGESIADCLDFGGSPGLRIEVYGEPDRRENKNRRRGGLNRAESGLFRAIGAELGPFAQVR